MFTNMKKHIDNYLEGFYELEYIERMEREGKEFYNGYLLDETDKAVLFNVMIGTKLKKVWFPKSVISFYTDQYCKSQYIIVVPAWLRKSKKLP